MTAKKKTATKKYIWAWESPEYTTPEKAAQNAAKEYGEGTYVIYEKVGTANIKSKVEVNFTDK